ncbi:MAG: sortase domain-containing protein [Chloroflexota bacterium]
MADPAPNSDPDRRQVASVGLALIPAAALIIFLAARLAVPSLANLISPPTPTRIPQAVVVVRIAPTPIPTATEAPPSPTPTVDATEVARLAATVATPTPTPRPPPTATLTVTPAPPRFVTKDGVYRREDGPVTLIIPKIKVTAPVESVGLDRTGAMATPTTAFRVAWYDGGPLPGKPGNAVIDGHLDSRIYGEAVFWNLDKLAPGDKVEVAMPDRRTLTFVVDRVAVYPYDKAPLDQIFGPASAPNLNLITCSGVFDRASDNYNRRRVIYTRLAGA